jgi:predicted regulator of Ras-like GTPase activity (Roadblock/LC7/MglB family)
LAGDDIRSMSEKLAADPQSLVFIPLAEALLARGDLAHAARVAQRGAARHPKRADSHDLVARIALAQGDEPRAEEEWSAVLALDPGFGTAHRGLGLVRYRQGRLDEALGHLVAASNDDPGDPAVRAALDAVQGVVRSRDARATGVLEAAVAAAAANMPAAEPTGPDDPGTSAAALFDPILEETKQVALLLDRDGLVAAGSYLTAEGEDLGAGIGAHLSGVGDEADRAIRHFGLGRWTRIAIETEAAAVNMAPIGESVVLVAAPREVPLGYVRRTLERFVTVAREWLGEPA